MHRAAFGRLGREFGRGIETRQPEAHPGWLAATGPGDAGPTRAPPPR